MFHLSANIGDIEIPNPAELVTAFVPNIFGNDGVGIRSLVDILLDVFQESSAVLSTRIRKHHLFLYLARDMVPFGGRVFVIGGQGRPIELLLNHFDDPDPDGDRASDDGRCHGLYL